jgi:hypothetical protein
MNKRLLNLRKSSKALAGLPVLSQTQISKRWKLDPDTVRKLLRDHSIPTAPGPWKRARYAISEIWRVEGVSAATMSDPEHHTALFEPLLTANDLAELLDCVPATVRNYARDELLKSIRLGTTIRFRRCDVSAVQDGV